MCKPSTEHTDTHIVRILNVMVGARACVKCMMSTIHFYNAAILNALDKLGQIVLHAESIKHCLQCFSSRYFDAAHECGGKNCIECFRTPLAGLF